MLHRASVAAALVLALWLASVPVASTKPARSCIDGEGLVMDAG
jgi:hypothetical protein